jgi:hypothetical protein
MRDEPTNWQNVRREIVDLLNGARKELEAPQDQDQTSFIRGQIAALKTLLEKIEPEFTPGSGGANYN